MTVHNLLNKYKYLDSNEIILLLQNVLGVSYSKLLLMDEIVFGNEQIKKLEKDIERVKSGEPIQYVIGTWDFLDIVLKVDERALIPRPETEELALQIIKLCEKYKNPRVIDIGCGTGCIGLYVKSKVPSAEVTLCDISKDAINLASENAKALNLDVLFLHMDMRDLIGEYNIIVSNPPYITKNEMKDLDKSVVDYEPYSALYGGVDGLNYYKVIADKELLLTSGGHIALEIGMSQGKSVSNILSKDFVDINVIKDIAGHDRIVIGTKKQDGITCFWKN